MSVISRYFADELTEKEMRDEYLAGQTRVKIAHQIRALRNQRGWSQGLLGEKLGKPQSNISRLEDVEVGKYTLTTLLELASAFDVGLLVEFVAYDEFLRRTENLNPDHLQVPSFDRAALESLTYESLIYDLSHWSAIEPEVGTYVLPAQDLLLPMHWQTSIFNAGLVGLGFGNFSLNNSFSCGTTFNLPILAATELNSPIDSLRLPPEVSQLRQENYDLRKENARLREENAKLRSQETGARVLPAHIINAISAA
jgi:transcriptional regulator with XRE-family HTH domain